MSVTVLTDSTADLPAHIIEEMGQPILPLIVHMGEEERHDGVDVTPEEIYAWSDRTKTTPKTAAPEPERCRAFLQDARKTDEGVFYTGISFNLSATHQVVRLAQEDFFPDMNLTIHDSMAVSYGIGQQVTEAYRVAQQGASLKELSEYMLDYTARSRIDFIIDTTLYLYRGGRCSALVNMSAGLLNIKPSIIMRDGRLLPGPKYHGKMAKSALAYIHSHEKDFKNALPDAVYLIDAGRSPEDVIRSALEAIEGYGIFERIEVVKAGSVISSHCGPGTIGLAYTLKS